jgi:putative ABC transport system permease protein
MSTRGFRWISTSVFDLRHAVRSLVRNPTLSTIMLLVLTTGIAANTTIFSVFNEVLLRPMPYSDAESLVMAWERNPALGEPLPGSRVIASWKNFEQWRYRSHSFTALEAFDQFSYNLTGLKTPLRINGARATTGFFNLLGVDAQMGRVLLPGDVANDHVALLSDKFFRAHFSGSLNILGQTILLDGEPYEIVGVLPSKFHLPSMWQGITEYKPDLWVPLPRAQSADALETRRLFVFARLRRGVALEQAKADLNEIARQLIEEDPKRDRGWSANVFPLRVEDVDPAVRSALYVLSASALFILLIACANLANLMLARNLGKQKEMAIHLALGGTRARLIGRAFAESLLLTLTAGVLGLILARLGVKVILVLHPGNIHSPERIHVDIASGIFALALCILTAILFGPLPAWLSTRANPAQTLKEYTRVSTHSHLRPFGRRILLVVQVAISVFLAVFATLMIRSFQNVLAINPGFRGDHILTAHMVLPQKKYAQREQRIEFCARLLRDVQALPGVNGASLIDNMPLYDIKLTYFIIDGHPVPARETPPVADYANVTRSFFETLGIHAHSGRLFAPEDFADDAHVAIINQTLATRYWPGRNPVGEYIRKRTANSPPLRIIGVVNDFVQYSVDTPPRPEIFWPTNEMQEMTVVIEGAADPMLLAPSLQAVVRRIDPDQPVSKIQALDEMLRENVAQRRFDMVLLSIFAAISVGIALVGLYGLLNFTISERSHDFAIRRALGAQRKHIVYLLLSQIVRPLIAGVLLGILLSRLGVRIFSDLLFGVTVTDSVAFVVLPLSLVVVSFVTIARPAWRATAADPGWTLRHE